MDELSAVCLVVPLGVSRVVEYGHVLCAGLVYDLDGDLDAGVGKVEWYGGVGLHRLPSCGVNLLSTLVNGCAKVIEGFLISVDALHIHQANPKAIAVVGAVSTSDPHHVARIWRFDQCCRWVKRIET